MGRVLAIDYGRRRCGVAVTDILKIAANGLPTVRTCDLEKFLTDYVAREDVELILVGEPRTVRGEESESMRYIRPAVESLRRELPDIPVEFSDERFTSVLAHRAMLSGGMKKKDRQNKAVVDEISATILLNDYLTNRK